MRNVAVLGSTGSVGQNALEVIKNLNGQVRLFAIAARSNWRLLSLQIKKFKPRLAAILDQESFGRLKQEINTKETKLLCGKEAIEAIPANSHVDVVLCAITGAEGLFSSIETLEHGKSLALANKESIVMAGDLLRKLCKLKGGVIIPVDSEHSAVFQSIQSRDKAEINKITLTASGGPFLKRKSMNGVGIKEALDHPIWKMGPRITIDSATLMNKALEIVEACYLFDLKPNQVDVIIHPQSVIHSLVHFCDGSIMAHMCRPDMRIPIQYSITYPRRLKIDIQTPDLNSLTFEQPDTKRFPSLLLGHRAIECGGTMPAVMNASDERAVAAFLAGKIPFNSIYKVVDFVMSKHNMKRNPGLGDILDADAWSRRVSDSYIVKISKI